MQPASLPHPRLTLGAILAHVLLVGACLGSGPATRPATLFDPARHMRVSEVRPGMKGYGLSVFYGTRIERFDVEVVSVLHNAAPQADMVLIRCAGANLEHTGPIQGMSGSPIFLTDEAGKSRMIGAFAFGWAMSKDPIAGVQPIEYMLELPDRPDEPAPAGQPLLPAAPMPSKTCSVADWGLVPGVPGRPERIAGHGAIAGHAQRGAPASSLRPMIVPLSVAGLSPRAVEAIRPLLAEEGLELVAAAPAGAPPDAPPPELEPGASLMAILLSGDMDMSATGTTTEVIGGRVFGYGHPLLNEGATSIPMGTGYVHGVIATLMNSFKLGGLVQARGALHTDQSAGVSGRVGDAPRTVPIDLHLVYDDGTLDRRYHYEAAQHPRLTPVLALIALQASVEAQRVPPALNTMRYDLTAEFNGGRTLRFRDTLVNGAANSVLEELAASLRLAADNPFERVPLRALRGEIRVAEQVVEAQILSVNLPRVRFSRGETVRGFVTFRPFRGAEQTMPIALELPSNLPDGDYQLVVSDADRFLTDDHASRPFRFTFESADELFQVLRDITDTSKQAVYLRLLKRADGVALGRVALPGLPSSRRHVLLDRRTQQRLGVRQLH